MKLTQELINVLQGIHDGKPWQWGDSKDSWIDAIDRNNAIGLMSSGYRIRLKPEPDPYAEAKQAWRDGELQHRLSDNCDWGDWPFKSEPTWCCVPSRYRRKPKPIPKPVRVPLGPEDVPPGSAAMITKEEKMLRISLLIPQVIRYIGGRCYYKDGEVFIECKNNDLFSDLNACRAMEECLEDDRPEYEEMLCKLTNHILCTDNLEEIHWRLIHLKAEHRAEAFGLAMRLWKEGE